MRTDQYDRLKQLSEKLTDVVLIEGDAIKRVEPTVAQGRKNDQYLTQERRLHWRKKNTMATLGILMRIHSLVSIVERAGQKNLPPAGAPDEATAEIDAEAMIESAEKEVEKILDGLRRRPNE